MDNKQLLIYGGVFAVGAGIGFGVGYLVFKKKFEKISSEEIESVRKAYMKAASPKPNIEVLKPEVFNIAVKAPVLEDVLKNEGYSSEGDETDSDAFRKAHGRVPTTYELIQMGSGIEAGEAVRNVTAHDDDGIVEGNIFDNPQPDPEDLGEGVDEPSARPSDRPYVINVEEWYTNDTNYDQITLTYWADDDVLADDNQHVVHAVEEIVGTTNLHRFGFKSDDPDTVYVRNDQRKADYEITKDERNYSEIVHNIDPYEINNSGVPRRMRSNDE